MKTARYFIAKEGSKRMVKGMAALSTLVILGCATRNPKQPSANPDTDGFQNYYDLDLSDTEFDWIKTRVVLTDSLDKDHRPLNQIDEFKVDDQKLIWVYCQMMYLGPRRYWYSTELIDANGILVEQNGATFTPTGSSWMFYFNFKLKKSLIKPGIYRFRIKLNNRTLAEAPIKLSV